MKLTKFENQLSILRIDKDTAVAFSNGTPVAIHRGNCYFINNQYSSVTDGLYNRKHSTNCHQIAHIWGINYNESVIEGSTFTRLIGAISNDITNFMENRDPYFKQLNKLR